MDLKKNHTLLIKSIAILLMFIHHLFAFPERIEAVSYVSIMPFLKINGKNLEFYIGIFGKVCVAMYLFLSGYSLGISEEKNKGFTYKDSIYRIKSLYLNYWIVFIIFIPIEFILAQKSFNIIEFVQNLIGLSSSYNGEWWFFRLYIILILIFPISKKLISKNLINSLGRIGLIYSLPILGSLFFKFYPKLNFIKITYLYSLIHMVTFWQAAFFIGYIEYRFSIFNFIKIKLIQLNLNKKSVYFFMMLILIIMRIKVGVFFDFLIAPLFIFFIISIFDSENFIKISKKLGTHSTNMWLTHSFFCYTSFQKILFYLKYSILILIGLIFLTVSVSYVIKNFLYLIKDTMEKNEVKQIKDFQIK